MIKYRVIGTGGTYQGCMCTPLFLEGKDTNSLSILKIHMAIQWRAPPDFFSLLRPWSTWWAGDLLEYHLDRPKLMATFTPGSFFWGKFLCTSFHNLVQSCLVSALRQNCFRVKSSLSLTHTMAQWIWLKSDGKLKASIPTPKDHIREQPEK